MTSSSDTPVRIDVVAADFGTVHLTVTTDPDTGTSWYAVTAPRVTGTITVVHDPTSHETRTKPGGHRDYRDLPPSTDTGHAHLDYARRAPGTRFYSDDHTRPEPLTVNGIRLTGGTSATLARLDEGRLRGHQIACRRALGRYHSTSAPDRTADRTALIVTAVLTHWRMRPDGPALRLAAARAAAPGYLTAQARRRADLTAQRAHLDARLAELDTDIATARTLTTPEPTAA